MMARYIAVWKLHGANKVVAETPSLELASLSIPRMIAMITSDPEPHFLHIDKSAVLPLLLGRGLFAPGKEASPEEQVAAEIEACKAQRAKQSAGGVFLVFEGEKCISPPQFTGRWDTDEFALCYDPDEKTKIRATFYPFVNAALAALGLSLAPDADREVDKVGEAVYFVDPDNGKPIYCFTTYGGLPRISIASPLTPEAVAEAGSRVSKLMGAKDMGQPIRLINTSLDRGTDGLQGFIAAWSALEIFVNVSFKAHYKSRWSNILENGAPAAAKPVFDRFSEVMSDKYRLADKFLIIAAVLDAHEATADDKEFRKLKRIRDNLLHGLETPEYLPTEAIQKLVLKYIRLHLDTQS